MKKATVADLRNRFPKVFRWIQEGEQVELTKRGKLIARLVPASLERTRAFKVPDFDALKEEVFGKDWRDRIFSPEDSAAIRDRGDR
jgi:prevent-host-death family protein